jgi:hypothetical protein
MTEEPFLTLVSHIQRSNQRTQDLQLDLFDREAAVIANRIVKDVIDSIHGAGGNLSDLKIQQAVSAARERAIALLTSVLFWNSR